MSLNTINNVLIYILYKLFTFNFFHSTVGGVAHISEKCETIKFTIDKDEQQKNNYEYCIDKLFVKVKNGNVTFKEINFTGCVAKVSIRAHVYNANHKQVQFNAGEKSTEILHDLKDKSKFRICAIGEGCAEIEGKLCY